MLRRARPSIERGGDDAPAQARVHNVQADREKVRNTTEDGDGRDDQVDNATVDDVSNKSNWRLRHRRRRKTHKMSESSMTTDLEDRGVTLESSGSDEVGEGYVAGEKSRQLFEVRRRC